MNKNLIFKAGALCGLVVVLAVNANAYDKTIKSKTVTKRSVALRADLSNVKNKNVLFGFNRAGFQADYYPELDKVAKLMAENNAGVKLSGHADNKGTYLYNWKLSESRANAVKTYLSSKGVDTSRIAAAGFGDTKPIASNNSKAGRLKNRRVEIQFAQ